MPAELNRPAMKDQMRDFNNFIKKKYGDNSKPPPPTVDDPYPENEDGFELLPPNGEVYEGLYREEAEDRPDIDNIENYDSYIDVEVMLSKNGEHMQAARVIGQARDRKGKTMERSIKIHYLIQRSMR